MKVINPGLSIDATGSFGNSITFSHWKGLNVAKFKIQRNSSKTASQIVMRGLMSEITKAWKTGATVGAVNINSAYKLAFNNAAAGKKYTGFNLYTRLAVALNDGSAYAGTLAVPATPTSI